MKKLLLVLLAVGSLALTSCAKQVVFDHTYINEEGYVVVVYSDGHETVTDYKEDTITLTNIEIDLLKTKTNYLVGEEFVQPYVLAFYELTNYEEALSKAVAESCLFEGFDSSVSGEKEIMVSYTENNITKTTSYLINVNYNAEIVYNDALNKQLNSGNIYDNPALDRLREFNNDGHGNYVFKNTCATIQTYTQMFFSINDCIPESDFETGLKYTAENNIIKNSNSAIEGFCPAYMTFEKEGLYTDTSELENILSFDFTYYYISFISPDLKVRYISYSYIDKENPDPYTVRINPNLEQYCIYMFGCGFYNKGN